MQFPSEAAVRILLEEDGTEIEDEDYFQTLDENTIFMVLTDKEKWTPSWESPM